MKKLEIKSYAPDGGWNAESYEKHGTTLISNFLKIQKNQRVAGKVRLKRFLNNLFENQIEEVIKIAEKQASFKAYKTIDPWNTSLTRVFALSDFDVAGNFQSIQADSVNGAYNDAKRLLGDKPNSNSKPQNRQRSYKIASKVTKINNTTRKILRNEISRSINEGMTVPETSIRLRRMLPRMKRRIPTIVRTEMSRATDEGVKQAMKESRVITHCSVMGCEKEEPLFTYNGSSTCNVENVPIAEVDGVEFHINHTGAWVPSKFKTQAQIAKETQIRLDQARQVDPTAFPSKPRKYSRDSLDAHTRAGIFNTKRSNVHSSIKNLITGNQTETGWTGEKAVLLLGGALVSQSLRDSREFKNNNPNGRLAETVYLNPSFITTELPEYKPMQKASKMGSFEQTDAYLTKETSYIKKELIDEITSIGLTSIIEGINAGSRENYDRFYDNLKSEGHKLEGHFQASSFAQSYNVNRKNADNYGIEVPEYYIQRSIECVAEVLIKVSRGVFNKFYLYNKDKIIFKYEDDKWSVLNNNQFQDFVFSSRYFLHLALEGNDLPFLKNKDIIKDIDIAKAKDSLEEPDAKDCQIMSIEIITGVDKEDSELQPMNEEYKKAWSVLEKQISVIESTGNRLAFQRYVES